MDQIPTAILTLIYMYIILEITSLKMVLYCQETQKFKNLIKQLIPLIHAVHNCLEAAAASSDDAQGLYAKLRLCRRGRIILRQNLWVAKGFVSRSIGTVTDNLRYSR